MRETDILRDNKNTQSERRVNKIQQLSLSSTYTPFLLLEQYCECFLEEGGEKRESETERESARERKEEEGGRSEII